VLATGKATHVIQPELITVGWRELVDLPEWGVKRLPAKLDTGARTSALHVDKLVGLPGGRVAFEVVLSRRRHDRRIHVETEVVRTARVRASSGVMTSRLIVKTRLRLGPFEREIEVGLVDRGPMIHRMLIGRSGLAGLVVAGDQRYIVSTPRGVRARRALEAP
jgi:hypothetical protein